jgi:hypothetical protein
MSKESTSKSQTTMNTIELFWKDTARLSSLNYYLQWIGWGLVVIGAIITALSLIIRGQIDSLNKTENAVREQKILALETATRPVPFRDRLITQLNAISPQILMDLKTGHTNFEGDFKLSHIADLQRLSSEPGAPAYITFRETGRHTVSTWGTTNSAEFTLNPSLLNP